MRIERNLTGVLMAGALTVTALPAIASDQNPEPPSAVLSGAEVGLPTISVTAPEPAPESARRALSYPTTGLTREQFEAMPNQRMGDVLQRLPGVTMGGASGERKDVRLRGMDKEFTRTQFDGVQLTDGGEKREFQVWRFPSSLIGEVEIIRNPTAEFEADGIAGRIAVTTRDIPDERQIEAETGLGGSRRLNFGEDNNARISYGERFGAFGIQGAVSYLRDPIVKDKRKERIGGNVETEDEEKIPLYSDLFLDVGWFGDRHELHVKPMFLSIDEKKDKIKNTFSSSGALNNSELEVGDELKQTTAIIVDHRYRGPADSTVETKFLFSDTIEDKATQKVTSNSGGAVTKVTDEFEDKMDEAFEISSKVTLPVQLGLPNEFKFGGALRRRDRFRSKTSLETSGGATTDKTGPKDDYSLLEYYGAVFLQDTISVSETLSITPGLRYEHVIREPTSGLSVTSRATITDLLPSLHGVYRHDDQTTFRASVSRQINRPKFDELSPFEQETGTQFVIGNPNLKPARSWSIDIGADYGTKDHFFGVNVYHREIQDVIESVDTGVDRDGKDVVSVENVGDGYNQGIELEQRFSMAPFAPELLKNFSIRANQTFVKARLENDDGQKRRMKEQPDFMGNISLIYKEPSTATRVSLSGNYVSKIAKDEFSGTTERTEGEFYLDLYAETRLVGNVKAFGWIENITGEARRKVKIDGANTDIEEEGTGRTFFVGLKATF